ncbi:hypothetical protein ACKWTF_001515 [Chironomus riparius]
MKNELIATIVIIIIGNHASYSQLLNCSYRNNDTLGYTCDLTINNPNEFNNLTEISGLHMTGMTDGDVQRILSVTGSNSTNIPTIICEQFINVTRIELLSMGIQRIDESSFKNCKMLNYLDLKSNRITIIDEKSFIENTELQTLYLLSNQLSILPKNVFLNQQKLQKLWLNFNRLSNPPKNVFDPLKGLTELDWRGNGIRNLSVEWFEKLESLTSLHFRSNLIEELPKNVFSSLKKMTSLNIDANRLKIIHADSFGVLPSFTQINLSYNQIYAVDEKFIDKTGLKLIAIGYNLCVNSTIFDNTATRDEMRYSLQYCFNNYQNLNLESTTSPIISTTTIPISTTIEPKTTSFPGCVSGNIDERVCRLEDDNEVFYKNFQEIEEQNQQFVAVTDGLQIQIESLTKKNEDLIDYIGDLNESLKSQAVALEELKNQVLVLSTRPCSCQ